MEQRPGGRVIVSRGKAPRPPPAPLRGTSPPDFRRGANFPFELTRRGRCEHIKGMTAAEDSFFDSWLEVRYWLMAGLQETLRVVLTLLHLQRPSMSLTWRKSPAKISRLRILASSRQVWTMKSRCVQIVMAS